MSLEELFLVKLLNTQREYLFIILLSPVQMRTTVTVSPEVMASMLSQHTTVMEVLQMVN